ncbi:MAG: urate hydroxylase PuuD, partial [Acidobacteria bacterium]|nr:urate hydroxylase PuuD [Acidobacteriota bacterium]
MMDSLQFLFRWLHVFVGIIWIGHLYFFNFVNAPLAAKLDGPTKQKVVPELMPRALFWFRWGAAWTWITGVLLMLLVFYHGRLAIEVDASWGAGAIAMIGVSFLAVFGYDALWKSGLKSNVRAATIVSFVLLAVVVFLFVEVGGFPPRSVLIHTGAMFG